MMNEIGYVIMQLFVLLSLALLIAKVFERLKLPGLVGQIVVGIVFVSLVIAFPGFGEMIHFDLDSFDGDYTHFLQIMGELGIIFLLFTVGLETRFSDLRMTGKPALYIAVLGLVIPLICGWTYGYLMHIDFEASLLIGTAMFAMSTAISIEVLRNMNAMGTKEAKIIVSAAVIDDILCLSLLAVFSGVVDPNTTNATIVTNTLTVVIFLVGSFLAVSMIRRLSERDRCDVEGERIVNRRYKFVRIDESQRNPMTTDAATAVAMVVCLGMATLSATIGLAGIIGAFLAGMVFAEFKDRYPCEENFNALTSFMLPFFFIYVGMHIRYDELTASLIIPVILLSAIAIASKIVGGYLGARAGRMDSDSSVLMGMSMIPRGEVGIIVATLGLSYGVFTGQLFTEIVLMTIVTSLVAPSLISWSYRRMMRNREINSEPETSVE